MIESILPEENKYPRRKVFHIDPNSINTKMLGSFSPTYSYASKTPLGTSLKTPMDETPIQIPSNPSFLESVQTPYISKTIDEFLEKLPSKTNLQDKVRLAKILADYRVKYSILRDAYPNMNIPDPRDDETEEEIIAAYKEYVKKIHVESSVESNKVYLIILWLIIDILGAKFLGLPFGKYFKSQFNFMQKYHMLLIELGERSYIENSGQGWSVEVRIGFMAIFHGVIFGLVHMLSSKVGVDDKSSQEITNMIDDYLTKNKGNDTLRRAEQANTENPEPEKSEDSGSFNGLSDIIQKFGPMFMNMMGNSNASVNEAPLERKRPTTFGARRRNT